MSMETRARDVVSTAVFLGGVLLLGASLLIGGAVVLLGAAGRLVIRRGQAPVVEHSSIRRLTARERAERRWRPHE